MDGKFWKENEKENFFGACLVRWRGKKINSETHIFSLDPPKKFLPKLGGKLKRT